MTTAFDDISVANASPENHILWIARLLPSKNPDLLLDAVEILLDERPDLRVTFVGDGELFQRIKRRGKSILGENLTMAGSVHDPNAVADYMARATVVAVPDEGGLTMPHALAHGVPVVANNDPIRNNPEYEVLSPGGNSVTFTPGDANSFANALRSVLSGSEPEWSRSRIADKAREYLDPKRSARKIVDVAVAVSGP